MALSATIQDLHPRNVRCATSSDLGLPHDDLKTAFMDAFRHHPSGVALITADAGDGPVAMTVTSLTSVSASPPVFLFSAAAKSSSSPTILKAKTVVAHFLSPRDIDLARLGATSGVDRFQNTDRWTRLPTGEPLFFTEGPWLRAKVVLTIEVDGSTVVLAEVCESASAQNRKTPQQMGIAYANRAWHHIGSESMIPD